METLIQPKILKGFRDYLPEAEIQRALLQEKLTSAFRSFGFVPIDTPVLEYSEILLRKSNGETEKQVFRFEDNGGRDVAMRFDLTVPFARFTADMHEKQILHKDYSPGNILFDRQPDGSVAFEIVDINRMVFDKPVGLDTACRNFCRLWGKEGFFVLLAKEYAKARGLDEDKCIRFTVRYWKRFWRFRK